MAFGIGFYEESSEIRNILIDLFHFIFPPLVYFRVQRIGCIQSSQFFRGTETGCQIYPDAVRTKNICKGGCLYQIFGGQAACVGIYIVQNGAIDTDRSVGTGIIAITRIDVSR